MTTITLTQDQIDAVLAEHGEKVVPPVVVKPKPKPKPPTTKPKRGWNGTRVSFASIFKIQQDTKSKRPRAKAKNVWINSKDGYAFQVYVSPDRNLKITLVGHTGTRGGSLLISLANNPGEYESAILMGGGDYGRVNTRGENIKEGWYWVSVKISEKSWHERSKLSISCELQYSETQK
jgi:hypothetical protein